MFGLFLVALYLFALFVHVVTWDWEGFFALVAIGFVIALVIGVAMALSVVTTAMAGM